MKGFRGRSVKTHLIAIKAAGQPEIFMLTYNICDHICMQHVRNSIFPEIKQVPP